MNTGIVDEDLMKHHCLTKKAFYSSLNMEDITDVDYWHAKEWLNTVLIKFRWSLGLYVQSDTLLLADLFGKFRNMCIELYELDPTHFLSEPGLAWQACLKRSSIKLEPLTGTNMYWWLKKELEEAEYVIQYVGMQKKNNYYMKDYDKRNEWLYLMYLDANNLYGWTMSLKFSVDCFKWKKIC